MSADRLTLAGLALALAAGVVLALSTGSAWLWLAPPLLVGRIACNALEGMVAWITGTSRPFGAVLKRWAGVKDAGVAAGLRRAARPGG